MFAAKTESSLAFISCKLREPVRQKETYFHCGVTPPSKWLDAAMKSFILKRCFQVAVLLFILWCYSSTLDHHPLSNTLLYLTASSYKTILLYLSQGYSTAYAMIQTAEPFFCCCDKMPVCLVSL